MGVKGDGVLVVGGMYPGETSETLSGEREHLGMGGGAGVLLSTPSVWDPRSDWPQ